MDFPFILQTSLGKYIGILVANLGIIFGLSDIMRFFLPSFWDKCCFFWALPLQRVDLTRHGVIEAKGLIDRISVTFLWQSPVRAGGRKDNSEGVK